MKKLFCLLAALALLAQPLRAAEEPKRYLALTFDDGPSGELTERLLEGLAERQVHATSFVCGYRIAEFPDTLSHIAAAGHEIGLHSSNHDYMQKMDYGTAMSDLTGCAKAVENACGVRARLFRHPAYQAARSLYGYLSYNQEVRTAAILRRAQQDGKRVAVPKVFGDEMKFLWLDDLSAVAPGAYNIPEPVADGPEADDETALVLMPGLAFDPEGHRCGYGGGFYDKYLAAHPKHVTLALCYGFQMFSHLDTDAFDIPVQYVISAPVEEEKA